MKTHAVKELITDNRLYVEVEPQPAKPDIDIRKEEGRIYAEWGGVDWELIPPIAIGDTVYQGEEWREGDISGEYAGPFWTTKYKDIWIDDYPNMVYLPPKTMPIELADKTFKVVGVEVEEKMTTEMVPTLTSPPFMKPIHRDRWFWSYKLEAGLKALGVI